MDQKMMAYSLIKLATLFATFLVVMGCGGHVDRLQTFHIYGQVYDAVNQTPLKEVEIYFHDVGFDSVRRNDCKKGAFKVGKSDENGKFNFNFEYSWDFTKFFLIPNPKETFKLVIKEIGYEDKVIFYESRNMSRTGIVTEVSVGKVELKKRT